MTKPQAEGPATIPEVLNTLALYPAVSRAVHALVALGIPDLLGGSSVPAAELAEFVGLKVRPMRQLLRAAAGTGVLRGLPDDCYALSETGQYLQEGHPSSARDLILTHLSPAYQSSYNSLIEGARTGHPAFRIQHGRTVFDYYAEHIDEYESFNRMMIAYLGGTPEAVASAYDFGDSGHIIDCGGGIGTQLAAFLAVNENMTGTLFDTSTVIEQAAQFNPPNSLATRWTTAVGDFFRSVPEGGDFYVLSHIIHDWDDAEAVRILRTCVAAAAPSATFLLIEEIIPDGDGLHPTKMLDVALLATIGGGERTLEEFDALLASAGLVRTRVLATGTTVSIIEASSTGNSWAT